MNQNTKRITGTTGAVLAAGLAAGAVLLAAPAASAAPAAPTAMSAHHKEGKQTLSAEVKDAASKAALAKVDGTVTKVRASTDGGFEVVVKQADGTRVLVKLDKNYGYISSANLPAKTETKNDKARGDRVEITDAQKEAAGKAATAKVPGTAERVHATNDGGFEVVVKQADGTRALVKLDKDYGFVSSTNLPAKSKTKADKTGSGHRGR